MKNPKQISFNSALNINQLLLRKNLTVKTKATLVSLFILLVFYSCEKTSIEQETTFFEIQGENGFVGNLDGTNAFISILLGEEEGIVYICNGGEGISEWFIGQISDTRKIHFTNTKGAKITASLINNSFEGETTMIDGSSYPFKATVNTGIYGGIYKVIDEKAKQAGIEATWVVKSEEDQRGSITFQSHQLPTITLLKKNFDDINDGTSNTISIKGTSFSVFRYKVKTPTRPSTSSPSPPSIPIPYPLTSG